MLIDVVDMWVYSRFFFLAVVVYLADFTCIVYGECICNQGVCDIDCVIYKKLCKVFVWFIKIFVKCVMDAEITGVPRSGEY